MRIKVTMVHEAEVPNDLDIHTIEPESLGVILFKAGSADFVPDVVWCLTGTFELEEVEAR